MVAAQFNLGAMYHTGRGVPQDYTEARKWYRKAADQGNAYAQFALGLIYEKGRGVPQDYVEALKWYRKAADQGNPWAQLSLGLMYTTGQGVPQDYVQAYKWFTLAGAAENRDRAAAMMTPAQIAEAERLAREWKPTK